MKHFLLLFVIFLALPAVLLSMPFQNRPGARPVPAPFHPVSPIESAPAPLRLAITAADTCPICGMKNCPCHNRLMAAYKTRSTGMMMLDDRNPKTNRENEKVSEGTACHLSQGKGNIRGICKMCGCRMRLAKADLDKTCTYCKCGKKMKDCMFDKH